MAGCTINAYTRNSKGEVVESKLWKDLLSFTSKNRSITAKYYAIGTDQKFLDMAKKETEYAEDENGQITFKSLRTITHMDLKDENMIEALNKSIKAGKMPFNEAVQKMISFNQSSEFKDEFMATVSYSESGKDVNLHIVKRTSENVMQLKDTLKNLSMQDRLINLLAQKGISVKFLENADYQGRYSTKNATKNALGFYDLIEVVAGNKEAETLSEEAGHAILGMLDDSPLTKRFLESLTPEVQEKLIEKYGLQNHSMGNNRQRELAGYLLGRALNKKGTESSLSGIINRILTQAKYYLSKLTGNDIKAIIAKSELYADFVAEDFYNGNLDGIVDRALDVQEERFSAVESDVKIIYKDVMKSLDKCVRHFDVIDSELAKALRKELQTAKSIYNEADKTAGKTSDIIAIAGLFTALQSFNDQFAEVADSVDEMKFDATTFIDNALKHGNTLRKARNFVINGEFILTKVDSLLSSGVIQKLVPNLTGFNATSGGVDVSLDLEGIRKDLHMFLYGTTDIVGLSSLLKVKEAQFFTEFLSSIYGQRYVNKTAAIVFKGLKLVKQDAQKIFFSGENGLVNKLHNDVSLFERFLGSMCNSEDVVAQLMDVVTKQAQHKRNSDCVEFEEELKHLRQLMKERLGHTDTSIFFEKAENPEEGVYTGTFVGPVYYGRWELEYEKFIKDVNKRFLEKNRIAMAGWTDFEKGIEYQKFRHAEEKKWHKGYSDVDASGNVVHHPGHSVYDVQEHKYVPSTISVRKGRAMVNYTNNEYDIKFSDEEKEILEKFKALKKKLDGFLPEGAVSENRVPQFKGRFANKFRNRRDKMPETLKNNVGAFMKTLWAECSEAFCEDSDDSDYGCQALYNSEEDTPFGDEILVTMDKFERLPLFGINRLKNRSDLSTDLFDTMMAYAFMSANYNCMNNIIGGIEVGRQVMQRRHLKKSYNAYTYTGKPSYSYERFSKYVSKNIYNVSIPRVTLWKICLNKLASTASSLASKLFLGGNVQGGITNLGTGAIEVFKEGLAGENYSFDSYKKANALYFKALPEMMKNDIVGMGKDLADQKYAKLFLLLRRWDVFGKQAEHFRDSKMQMNATWNFIKNESLFLPYKIGEHYMQSIAFMATALETTVIDEDGNKVNLIDAYEMDDITSLIGTPDVGKVVRITKPYYQSTESKQLYEALSAYIQQAEKYYNDPINESAPVLTDEVSQWILDQEQEIPTSKIMVKHLKALLEVKQEDFLWNAEKVEASFINKAREINNRMHGIYNKTDQTVLHQLIIGNMFLAMKGYALGLIERRVSLHKESAVLKHDSEGSSLSALKFLLMQVMDADGIKSAWVNTLNLGLSLVAPFSQKATKRLSTELIAQGFSMHQIANLKRNTADGFMIGILYMLALLTAKPEPPDTEELMQEFENLDAVKVRRLIQQKGLPIEFKDENKKMKSVATLKKEVREYYEDELADENIVSDFTLGIIHYFTQRWFREQAAFFPMAYDAVKSEADNLTEKVPAGVSATFELADLMYLGIGAEAVSPEEAKENNDTRFYYSSTKQDMYEKWKDSKFKVKAQKLIPYYRTFYMMQNPYEASKTYEYKNHSWSR